jgi:N-carbamoylputrescine amidase
VKVTVCELTNEPGEFERDWQALATHVQMQRSDLVLLPEMPFHPWLAHTQRASVTAWQAAVAAHDRWIGRLNELSPAVVLGTRPTTLGGRRLNEAYVWTADQGYRGVHAKYYLPEDEGFWEASWYHRGDKDFALIDTARGKIGFLICTEIWFNAHARTYAQQGIQLLACPRATPTGTADKWLAGGRVAAVVSGAYCLSSNLTGRTQVGGDYAGRGWIIEPEEGNVLGVTTADQPLMTLEIDLSQADKAKKTYPRYVPD